LGFRNPRGELRTHPLPPSLCGPVYSPQPLQVTDSSSEIEELKSKLRRLKAKRGPEGLPGRPGLDGQPGPGGSRSLACIQPTTEPLIQFLSVAFRPSQPFLQYLSVTCDIAASRSSCLSPFLPPFSISLSSDSASPSSLEHMSHPVSFAAVLTPLVLRRSRAPGESRAAWRWAPW
jgi:hypothetical protein